MYIQGTGAQLTTNSVNVGGTYTGDVYVLDGGTYLINQHACIAHGYDDSGVYGAVGSMTVSGNNSLFKASGYLNMGHSAGAVGTLNIINHGTVEALQLQIGTSVGSKATVNIKHGILNAGGGGIKGAAGSGTLNIYGSGSTITSSGGFDNPSEGSQRLQTNILLDSTAVGNSPIQITGGSVYLSGKKLVTAYGTAVQKSSTQFTIFDAKAGLTYTGTFPLTGVTPNLEVVSNGTSTGKFILGFSNSILTWDMYAERYFFTSEYQNDSFKYDGWVKPVGGEDFIARFVYDNAPNSDWLAALLRYVNEGMAGSSVTVSTLKAEGNYADFVIGWSNLNPSDGYDLFGWGLTHFNNLYGTDVRLLYLTVPEPATWLMLLSGAALLVMRKKRK